MHQVYLTVTGRLLPGIALNAKELKPASVVEQATKLECVPFGTICEAVMFALTNRPMMAFTV